MSFLKKIGAMLLSLMVVSTGQAAELSQLDLEDLLALNVTPGMLTKTDRRNAPVSATTITEEDIRLTSARNLYDVLEIYVPGFQHVTHFDSTHMGLRGLQVDRDYTFLLSVNGRLMNQRSHNGPITELENWDMNDIAKIEVIRGPGSVTYGPGAVAGVISITTKNAASAPGTQAGVKYVSGYRSGGAYASTSFKKENLSGYIHGSFNRSEGYKNPDVFTLAMPSDAGGSGYVASPRIDYYPDYRDRPQMKFHSQFNFKKDWTFWARYTNSGTNRFVTWTGQNWFQKTPTNRPQGGNRQYVLTLENNHGFGDNMDLKSLVSWSSLDCERIDTGSLPGVGAYVENYAENDLTLKSTLRYNPAETWKTALGVEYTYTNLGKGWGDHDDEFIIDDGVLYLSHPNSPASASRSWIGPGQQLYTNSFDLYNYALLGEVSKSLTPALDLILSSRLDKNEYSKWALSPRVALVYDAESSGIYKLSLQRSIRENTLLQLYANHYFKNPKPDPEKFNGAELSYSNKVKSLDFDVAAFYSDVDLLGWAASNATTQPSTSKVGELKVGGLELEVKYKSPAERVVLGASHAFAKQLGFKLAAGSSGSFISRSDSNDADGNGVPLRSIGSDRMNWANHRTKVHATEKIGDKVRLFQSARVAWGYEGQKNWLKMYEQGAKGTAFESIVNDAVASARKNDLFGVDARVDLSASYQVTDPLSVTVFGQNVLRVTRQWRYMYSMVSSAATEEPMVFGLRLDYRI